MSTFTPPTNTTTATTDTNTTTISRPQSNNFGTQLRNLWKQTEIKVDKVLLAIEKKLDKKCTCPCVKCCPCCQCKVCRHNNSQQSFQQQQPFQQQPFQQHPVTQQNAYIDHNMNNSQASVLPKQTL